MATEATKAASACVNEFGGAIGMPQLCGEWFGNQIFWLIITLVVIYLILSRVALPRIGGVLAERSGTIGNDLAVAEELRQQAVEAEAAYEKALAEARAEAQEIAAKAKAQIQGELAKQLAKADAEISAQLAESEAAIANIRASAVESVGTVARETAEALVVALGGTTDSKAVDAAVKGQIEG
ncbi:MAG: F0F1 ATP synthase subunit B' [Pseudomonadota bacterium]